MNEAKIPCTLYSGYFSVQIFLSLYTVGKRKIINRNERNVSTLSSEYISVTIFFCVYMWYIPLLKCKIMNNDWAMRESLPDSMPKIKLVGEQSASSVLSFSPKWINPVPVLLHGLVPSLSELFKL